MNVAEVVVGAIIVGTFIIVGLHRAIRSIGIRELAVAVGYALVVVGIAAIFSIGLVLIVLGTGALS